MLRKLAISIIVFLFFAAPLYGEDSSPDTKQGNPAESQVPLLKVQKGLWVVYLLEDKMDRSKRELTLGIVSKKGGPNGEIGIEISGESKTNTLVAILAILEMQNNKPVGLERLVVQTGEYPPVELNPNAIPIRPANTKNGTYTVIGKEQFAAPAGKFTTNHARFQNKKNGQQDLWLSDLIPLFGVVRAMSPKYDLEIVAHGSDYTPLIVAPPIEIDVPIHPHDKKEELKTSP